MKINLVLTLILVGTGLLAMVCLQIGSYFQVNNYAQTFI